MGISCGGDNVHYAKHWVFGGMGWSGDQPGDFDIRAFLAGMSFGVHVAVNLRIDKFGGWFDVWPDLKWCNHFNNEN